MAGSDPGGGVPSPGRVPAGSSVEFTAVAEVLTDAMANTRIPGAALGILSGDREEHACFGVASMNTLLPVTADTLFQTGSLSKTYTATAIWHLIDQGILALDVPVRTYLPNLRLQDEATAARVTINDLLQHAGGWYGDDGTHTGENDDGIARYVAERLSQLPQHFPLGKFFSYNNSGFVLLGRLIEVATDKPYHVAMQDLVFGPLGLSDTVLDHADVLRRAYSDGHYAGEINGKDRVGVQTPLWVPRSVNPAGGIWSTTRDVIRYARMHLAVGETTGLLSAHSRQAMQEPARKIPGLDLNIGRSWFVQDVAGVRTIMHSGDTGGQHTAFVAIPEKRFALILFVNNVFAGAAAEIQALDAAMAAYPGLGTLEGKVGSIRALLAAPGASTSSMSSAELTDYTGCFADPGMSTTFESTDAGLTAASVKTDQPNEWKISLWPPIPTHPAPVAFVQKDTGTLNGALLPFIRDDAGDVQWMASGFRLVPRTAP